MSLGLMILCGGAAVFAIWFYIVYVGVIKTKNQVKEALSGIDVQLKKRYDVIPNVLFLANKFMDHERSLIEDITRLRTETLKLTTGVTTINDKINIDNEIRQKMSQLMVSVENYPQLKSDATMVQAMRTYNEVEEHIAASRRFYNSAVRDLKNVVEIWPSSMIAASLGVRADLPFFEATEVEKAPINASNYFN